MSLCNKYCIDNNNIYIKPANSFDCSTEKKQKTQKIFLIRDRDVCSCADFSGSRLKLEKWLNKSAQVYFFDQQFYSEPIEVYRFCVFGVN